MREKSAGLAAWAGVAIATERVFNSHSLMDSHDQGGSAFDPLFLSPEGVGLRETLEEGERGAWDWELRRGFWLARGLRIV